MKRKYYGVLMALLLVCFTSLPAQEKPQSAYEVVQQSTNALLDMIVQNRELYRNDTERFYQDVDGLLSGVVDFERIARRVMAKYYRNASDEQREQFVKVFKQSLMNVYAKGLLEFDNEKVEIIPPRYSSADEAQEKVDLVVIDNNGAEFPISYSMYLDDNGRWKMENVIVNGINIGLTYRNQFAHLMQAQGNDVDKVIASWVSEVKSEDS